MIANPCGYFARQFEVGKNYIEQARTLQSDGFLRDQIEGFVELLFAIAGN